MSGFIDNKQHAYPSHLIDPDDESITLVILERKLFLSSLSKIRDRLYREDRLSGDDQRDMAHILDSIVRSVYKP